MATIAMMLGGAVVNALAFSGSSYMFSLMRDRGVDEERVRHDKAIEELQTAHEAWSRRGVGTRLIPTHCKSDRLPGGRNSGR